MRQKLETDRLLLRVPNEDDLPSWHRFFQSDRAKFEGGGPDRSTFASWLEFASLIGHWAMKDFGPLVFDLKSTGETIGCVAAWQPDGWPEREIGWEVWEGLHEGKGYAFEAAQAVQAHLFHDLGWLTAVSYISAENVRSVRLAERLGCVLDPDAKSPNGIDLVYRHSVKALNF